MDCAKIDKVGGDLNVVKADKPSTPEKGILVRTVCAGMCHSDVHLLDDTLGLSKMGIDLTGAVLGHEISGVVEEIGSQASDCTLKVGDSVVVYPWIGCNIDSCNYCKAGLVGVCDKVSPADRIGIGPKRGGGYGSYCPLDDWRWAFKFDSSKISHNVACMLPCSVLTACTGVEKIVARVEHFSKFSQDLKVLIIGCGGLGLWGTTLCQYLLPRDTVKVWCADISEDKLALAKEAGADGVVLLSKTATVEENVKTIVTAAGGKFVAAADFVGMPQTQLTGLYSLHNCGELVCVGLHGDGVAPFNVHAIIFKELTISAAMVGNPNTLQKLIDLFQENKVKPLPLEYLTLKDVNTFMTRLRKGEIVGRAIIKYGEEISPTSNY